MKDSCWMLRRRTSSAQSRIVVRRSLAWGDSLSASVVSDALYDQGFDVTFQTHSSFHGTLRRQPKIEAVEPCVGHCHVNLDDTYEKDPKRKTKHFHQMWMEAANAQLRAMGINLGEPRNCKPRLIVADVEQRAARSTLEKHPRPWVFICPRSKFYAMRTVQDGVWVEAVKTIPGTKFWLGIHGPAPAGTVELKGMSYENVIRWLSVADLLVTVDTGPMHIAAALNTPIVAIAQASFPKWHLNDQCDFIQLAPERLTCLDCQLHLCPISEHLPPCQGMNPNEIARMANARLRSLTSEDVSAVVPIYQPETRVLNRCLAAVLPQVSEVVVAMEAKSIMPPHAMQHPKIRYVRTHQSGIGFGCNVNHGARHAHGKYLLILNDDVFLNPDAVSHMMTEMKEGVGIVVHLLRYESGAIYPTVCARRVGDKDWFHVDHMKGETSIPRVMEAENACGASWLIRRKAFFEIGGYDERFFMYCEDNDLSLRIREAGWRIIYTPRAKGIHVGFQSSQKLGKPTELCKPSIKLFHELWDGYLEHNRNKVPLGDFDFDQAHPTGGKS